MKKSLFSILTAGLMVFGIATLDSCKDPCKDVTCENGGACNEGNCDCTTGFFGTNCQVECKNGGSGSDSGCTCAAGYEGTKCETLMQTKFVGNFQGSEACTTGNDNYIVGITASSTDVTKIIISNIYNQGYTVTATVNGTSYTIASQTPAANVTVSGSGSISGNNLTLNYSIATSGGPSNSCVFTGAKM